MDDDCVTNAEMRFIGSQPDPIDAVLNGSRDGEEDLLHVAAVVHDLRSTYHRAEPLDVRQELAKFVGAQLTTDTDLAGADVPVPAGSVGASAVGRRRRKLRSMPSAVAGFVGTLTGKVVLTTAVAAASVGGLHAADVVDVPVLPDAGRPAEQPDPAGPAGAASEVGRDTAEANRAAADAYTAAVDEWTDCVAEAAAGQGDDQTRTTGGFDPRHACGDHPNPADYGLTNLPSQAAADDTPAATQPQPPAGTTPTTPASADPPTGRTDAPAPSTPEPPATAPAGGAPDATPAAKP